MSSPCKVESPVFSSPSIFRNPKIVYRRKLLVLAMMSVPSRNPAGTTSSSNLVSADRTSPGLVKGAKLESLYLEERTRIFHIEDFLDKVKGIPFKDSSEILSIMQKDARNWTLSDFNALLMALVTANEPDLASELFSNVASYGLTLTPNCWTFSIMIRCCCKKNDLDEAQRFRHHMMENGLVQT